MVGELASPKVTNGLPEGLVTTVHVPVSPGAGLLAAITADVLLIVWFGPAIAVVTTVLVKTTSADTVAHPALVSVQRRVAGDEVTVTEEVGELMLEIFAPPPTTLHVPVAPNGAADAAMVNVLLLQLFRSGPAVVEVKQGVKTVRQKPSIFKVLQPIEACTLTLVVPEGATPDKV